ncbi:RNA chaperone ProQ [Pseudidiomarina piscicola]|uniref:RNA chaperone ProQ n=1 Tax=Pseudidiomarina piscicola TaxID=2614830 RepID=A0A6S6WM13_9GAMM|nr:RNA chaperone ProQ [Pseudidiomarina piscicola]CAB0149975.1 RNA chaperone ProQ [Pseudidiomarina piscicola]VZT39421.1 RNA chaperone ProQ [Pseudomonas aeruginosa]
MSEVKKLSNNKEVIGYLAEKFPACFSLEGDAKPLKIGIFEDLAKQLEDDEALSKTRLRTALRHYTNSWRYLRAMKKGAERVDLNGEAVSTVDEEQQTHAAEALAQSKAAAAERKKAAAPSAPRANARRAKVPGKAEGAKASHKPARKKPAKKPAQPKLQAADSASLQAGQKVQVKAGKQPVAGEVVEIDRNDVVVQLHNGLTVKVAVEAIFLAQQE